METLEEESELLMSMSELESTDELFSTVDRKIRNDDKEEDKEGSGSLADVLSFSNIDSPEKTN